MLYFPAQIPVFAIKLPVAVGRRESRNFYVAGTGGSVCWQARQLFELLQCVVCLSCRFTHGASACVRQYTHRAWGLGPRCVCLDLGPWTWFGCLSVCLFVCVRCELRMAMGCACARDVPELFDFQRSLINPVTSFCVSSISGY